jgi:hypothetical protein
VSGANLLARVKRITTVRVPLLHAVLIVVLGFFVAPQALSFANRQLGKQVLSGTEKGLELTDLIVRVKSELAQAERQRIKEGEAALLELKDVDLEINFVVYTKANADAKLVAVSTAMEVGQEKTQKTGYT